MGRAAGITRGGRMRRIGPPGAPSLALWISLAAHAAVVTVAALAPPGRGDRAGPASTVDAEPRWTTVRLVPTPVPRRSNQARRPHVEERHAPASCFALARREVPLELEAAPAIGPGPAAAQDGSDSLVPASDAERPSVSPTIRAVAALDTPAARAAELPTPPEPLPRRIAPRQVEPPAAGPSAVAGVGRHKAATPVRVLHLPAPDYPRESRRLGEEGLVVLAVEVRPDGAPGSADVVRGGDTPRLVSAAKAAVRRARFLPATRGGRPVAATVEIPFRFELR